MVKPVPTGLFIVAILIVAWLAFASTAGTSKASKAPPVFEGPEIDPATGDYAPTARQTQTLEIDANIYSPTFGEPIDSQKGGQQ